MVKKSERRAPAKKSGAPVKASQKSASSDPSRKSSQQSRETTSQPAGRLSFPVQQRLLDVFERSFHHLFSPSSRAAGSAAQAGDDPGSSAQSKEGKPPLDDLLQEIKAALFTRDFAAAFTEARPELLEAYAARWSPSRALGYGAALLGLVDYLADISRREDNEESRLEQNVTDSADSKTAVDSTGHIRTVSIGGGAAEIAAVAAFLRGYNSTKPKPPSEDRRSLACSITLIDSAPWAPVIDKLHSELTALPPLSDFASPAAKEANTPFVEPNLLKSTFTQADALSMDSSEMTTHLGGTDGHPILLTLFFTLNELYTSSGIGKTTTFLLQVTETIPSGSLLVVVDSPGSYSEASVGKEAKKYPMHWLLDHCLLGQGKKRAVAETESKSRRGWEKIKSEDSVWFRLAEALRYPIQLENMRYQMHLYRAIEL